MSPPQILRNIAEYADRSATMTVAVILMLLVAARRIRPDFTEHERSALVFTGIWVAATFALTVWLPVRSSLYALLPSVGTSLAAGVVGCWAIRTNPAGFRTLAVVLPVLVVLLIPVYRERNAGWATVADTSTRVLQTIDISAEQIAQSAPGGRVVLVDAPGERFNLEAAFGGLFPDAVTLVLGPDWNGQILAPGDSITPDTRLLFRFVDGRLTPLMPSRSPSGRGRQAQP